MKKFIALVIGCMLVCGVAMAQTPPWINDSPPEGVLWGLGSAKQSNAGLSQITAEGRARQSLSFQLNSCIKAMITDHNRDAGPAGAQVNTSVQESITRIVSESNLNGTKVIKSWRAPDGTHWSLIEYSKELAKKWVKEVLQNNAEGSFTPKDSANLDEQIDHVSEASGASL
jgi:hypothetical protein